MLILASASPRRHDILTAAGIEHSVRALPIEETRKPNENPLDLVRRLAEAKARALDAPAETVILAADTTVVVGDQVFGKPRDAQDAVHMLRSLSGRDHWVYTGICLRSAEKCIVDVASTRVSFVDLEDCEIEEYTRSGEPYDKAGAYAIQGLASKFISGIEGCYQNVVGLPVSLVYQHLKSFQTAP